MRMPRSWGGVLILAAALVTSALTASGQEVKLYGSRTPLIEDWTNRRVVFSKPANAWQGAQIQRDPRYLQQYYRQNYWKLASGDKRYRQFRGLRTMERDWAVSLGAGGVARGMSPAKYTFNVNATPSCTADFAVFPINASTGNTRGHVVGTFTGEPASGQTASITITPTGGTAITLTLTASTTLNTGLDFEVSATTATDAANLAAAINRNLSATALDRVVAVASGAAVTVYALTPGNGVTLTDAETLANFTWGGVTNGTNGTQANIVAFNQLYSGSGSPLCARFVDPEFIFSYASGVGPVATSPNLSFDGTKIAYVENDLNIGAILHVLTFASGSTEYGTTCAASNDGLVMPTCATNPVIPGSTAGSTATDFMLPLGLVAANATTGAAGAADSFSSPFIDYNDDTTFVGDNNGYLYSITPTFNGTPVHAGGDFPVQVSTTSSTKPSGVTVAANVVTVTVANSLGIGELVTIAGVATNGAHCSAADVTAINGTQTVASATAAQFTIVATAPNNTTGAGCTVTNAAVTPGSNYLSAPVVDVSGTGNIFVTDSSANLYMLTQAGATAAPSLALGTNINGGIRDGALVDSTNAVGFVVTACSTSGLSGGEADTTNAGLIQFEFTSNTLTAVAGAELDTAANQSCSVAGYPIYDPTADARYYALGISNATAANNGEIIAASSGSGGEQLKIFQFVSSVLQTAPEAKPQFEAVGPSPMSPLTEFWDTTTQAPPVTALTATAGTPGVVTVTAANTLAANDMVTVSGVTANTANGCTAADVTAIESVLQTVASATATQFTFNATIPSATTGAGCTVSGATATGGPDYMFVGVEQNSPGLYSFLLPSGVVNNTITQTNTGDVSGGTSGIIVDNDSNAGQASSLYYGTLATSATICGATAAYCAIKVTQGALQ